MDPLAVVEEKLGIVDTWPSSVLTDMFYKEPKVNVSMRFAAFLHGNGVSARDAAKLYKASQAAWRNVSETYMYGWYMQWGKCVPSTPFYSDIKRKSVMLLVRYERVEPEITGRNFGPAISQRPFRIKQRITAVRRDRREGENV
jgi:hypothetical protein